MKRFRSYSEMNVQDGTFRLCCDARNDNVSIQYFKAGVQLTLFLNLDQALEAGKELIRMSEEGKVILRDYEYARENPPPYNPALPENAVKLDAQT